MSNFRDTKYAARRDLHRTMQVPVYVFSDPYSFPKVTFARIHRKDTSLGSVLGTSFAYAERREQEDKIIFLVEDHVGSRDEVAVVSPDEMYQLDHDEPTYNVTKTWYVLALDRDQRELYGSPQTHVYAAGAMQLPRLTSG